MSDIRNFLVVYNLKTILDNGIRHALELTRLSCWVCCSYVLHATIVVCVCFVVVLEGIAVLYRAGRIRSQQETHG